MKNLKRLFTVIMVFGFIVIGAYFAKPTVVKAAEDETNDEVLYISDMNYTYGRTAWGSITKDRTASGTKITVLINGGSTAFDKGMWAHAASTLIYDVPEGYDYFAAYVGVNTTAGGNGNGVKFYIYTSEDGSNWDLRTSESPAVKKGNTNADFIVLDVRNASQIKLVADDNSGNGSDHAVYADAKFIKESYYDASIKNIAYYDELIKTAYSSDPDNKAAYEELVLKRDLVNKVGYYQLQDLVKQDPMSKKALNWLMGDIDALRLYLHGGSPKGTYARSFNILGTLLSEYEADLDESVADHEIHKKMMIALSLTHASDVYFWVGSSGNANPNPNVSDASLRYRIYRDQLANDKLYPIFRTLKVEEMRCVMGCFINDDEIVWAQDFTKKKNSINPYNFMKYKNVNTALYRQEAFFDPEQVASTWSTMYGLEGHSVSNITYYPKLWMVMNVGGVCWQISNMGNNLWCANGIPSIMMGQPQHSVYLGMSRDANGNGTWAIGNDVFGWTKTNSSAYAGNRGYYAQRLLIGWGNASYASGNNGTYVLLGQAAMNDYANFEKAEEYLMLSRVYQNDPAMREALYRKAIAVQPFNLDAWDNLITMYLLDTTKTETDYYNLAAEMAAALKYYPLPMSDQMRRLSAKATTPAVQVSFTNLLNLTLKAASTATDAQVLQSNIVRSMASTLLGTVDTRVADFSFDGENGGILSLASRFEGSEVAWDYSLDGGNTWTQVIEHSVKLSDEEIASITADNDIKVHLIGVDYSEVNISKIDIILGVAPTGFYNNDRENRIITENTADYELSEWRLSDDAKWVRFTAALPDLTGNKTLQVRKAATGVYAPSPVTTFAFTADTDTEQEMYIPLDRVSVYEYSSQQSAAEAAEKSIDGNRLTMWHNNYAGELYSYIVLKLDESEYLSAMEYWPRNAANNGRLTNGKIYVSMDAVNWTEVATLRNFSTNNERTPDYARFTPTEAMYIKLEWDNGNNPKGFASASMINLFMDNTKTSHHLGGITYDYSNTTFRNVTATFSFTRDVTPVALALDGEAVSLTDLVTVDAYTYKYTFTDNGTVALTYKDNNPRGISGTVEAAVTWIDRVNPVADIVYSHDGSYTNEDITATVSFNRPVEIISDKSFTRVDDNTFKYVFTQNETFDIEFEDGEGRTGSASLHTDWIDKTIPEATVTYENMGDQEQVVRAKIRFSENVYFIEPPIELTGIEEPIADGVYVTVYIYDFTENGSFEISFRDDAGNTGTVTIAVDSIASQQLPDEESGSLPDGHIHTFCDWAVTTDPTCTESGSATRTCVECGETETREIGRIDHTEEVMSGKAATCTETGMTDGKHCAVCGEVTVPGTVIPAKGHKMASKVQGGYKIVYCTECGYVESKTETDEPEHVHTCKYTLIEKATLTANGKMKATCTECKEVMEVPVYHPDTFTLSKTAIPYNGKTQKPAVAVKDANGQLIPASNYTLTYSSGSKKIGKYTVKVTFKGNYSGSKTISYQIVPKAPSSFKLSNQKTSSFKVSWSKVSQAKKYTVYYSSNGGLTWKTKTVKKNNITLSKLSAGTAYLIKVVAVDKSGKYKSAQSAVFTAATKCKTPSMKAQALAKGTVGMAWNKVAGASSYTVYYATSKTGKYKALATVTEETFTCDTLTSGKTYYFKVTADKKAGSKTYKSAYSNIVKVKVQ